MDTPADERVRRRIARAGMSHWLLWERWMTEEQDAGSSRKLAVLT